MSHDLIKICSYTR